MALIHTHFFSRVLGTRTACDVVLPQRKAACRRADEPWPVLWMLHGAGDDETSWARNTSIERYVAQYGLAVVFPMAHLSRYADMVHGPRYFTYIADELPAIMRDMFPLSDKREDNLIAGASMGGVGSLRIGLSRPENYRAIGCFSAGFSNYKLHHAVAPDPRRDKQFRLAFGDVDLSGLDDQTVCLANELIRKNAAAPAIYHTCGSEDYLLNNAHEVRRFFESIPGNPFHYTYEEYSGEHKWPYWDRHVLDFLQWLKLPKRDGYLE